MWRVEESFRLFLFSKCLWAPSGYMNTSPNLFLPRLLKYLLNSYPLSIPSLPLQSLSPACTKVVYGCESWTIRKAERWRIDTFELWCWRSPLDSKEIKAVNPKGNQPWIFNERTDAEAEALILWPPDVELTHWKRPWLCETLRAGGERGNRGWDGWIISQTWWT